jgi:hypothetical protein
MEQGSIPVRVQFSQAVVLQGGGMGVIPQVIVVPSSRRKSLSTVSYELPKFMGVIVQVVPCRLGLAFRNATQPIDHDPIRLVLAEPADVSLHGIDATIGDLEPPRR